MWSGCCVHSTSQISSAALLALLKVRELKSYKIGINGVMLILSFMMTSQLVPIIFVIIFITGQAGG